MARIVDIARKPDVPRRAVARGSIRLRPATLAAIRAGRVEKGDPLAAAEVAGLHALKSTWQVLPHCHPIPITSATVPLEASRDRVTCTATVEATYKTGVEMEALYGVAVALLTVWDMVKALEKDARGQYPAARIEGVRVISKGKGRHRR
ncbi:MAG: molybdenum cofactor biosynthesis protein C [Euryarchaeota archaeon RBG_19FT_COMBO_69_17]|nr:MAG: molybdenum cofactor biosynthesis protein C [Euryarchaeota archaeon RBG_19FT_COMBO_69_17]